MITLNLPPRLEQYIADKAHSTGLSPEAIVNQLLEHFYDNELDYQRGMEILERNEPTFTYSEAMKELGLQP